MLFGKKRNRSEFGKIVVASKDGNKKDEGYNRLRDNVLYLNADGTKKVIQIEQR